MSRAIKTLQGVLLRAWGRGKVTNLLTVVVALTLATLTPAFAGTGVGAVFNIGATNTVNALTYLKGSVNQATLVLNNTNIGSAATALDLRVASGKPPMKVNSPTRVTNLNADKLDGKSSEDLMPTKTYTRYGESDPIEPGMVGAAEAYCLTGDIALGGGYSALDPKSQVTVSEPGPNKTSWRVQVNNQNAVGSGTTFTVFAEVLCADL